MINLDELGLIQKFINKQILTGVDGGLRRATEKLLNFKELLEQENKELRQDAAEKSSTDIISEKYRLRRQNEQLKSEISSLKHFGNCDNCEPLYCCSGRECGCHGMPVEYEPTHKCTNGCGLKVYKELEELKNKVVILTIDKTAHENCQRRLKDANERIVEFESIKVHHKKQELELKEQVKDLEDELDHLKRCLTPQEGPVLKEFGEFRASLRNLLLQEGIPSNPGWSNEDIIKAFKDLLDNPMLLKIEGDKT